MNGYLTFALESRGHQDLVGGFRGSGGPTQINLSRAYAGCRGEGGDGTHIGILGRQRVLNSAPTER